MSSPASKKFYPNQRVYYDGREMWPNLGGVFKEAISQVGVVSHITKTDWSKDTPYVVYVKFPSGFSAYFNPKSLNPVLPVKITTTRKKMEDSV